VLSLPLHSNELRLIVMNIKELCHFIQNDIHQHLGIRLPKTHIYELIASIYSYKTFAAFNQDAIVLEGLKLPVYREKDLVYLENRRLSLGYKDIDSTQLDSRLIATLDVKGVRVVSLDSLAWSIDDERYDFELPQFLEDQNALESLIEALQICCPNDKTHYALACLFAPKDLDDHYNDMMTGNSYWYDQRQNGRKLTGVEKEWADEYEHRIESMRKFELHLREAARLGRPNALFELAFRYGEPAFFESHLASQCTYSKYDIAVTAKELGRLNDCKHWMVQAAMEGDTDALGYLIEYFGDETPMETWIWHNLSLALGVDHTQDNYYAINDDGSMYDDDIGGPAFVGGEGGLDLPDLSEEEKHVAMKRAKQLASAITTD
jgi:hypothetical protein